MPFTELLFIGVGLAADAFAVAMCRGFEEKRFTWKNGLLTAFFFGFFQAAMPLIGFLLASLFADEIEAFDHWLAFVLLGFLGLKMVYEGIKEEVGNRREKREKEEAERGKKSAARPRRDVSFTAILASIAEKRKQSSIDVEVCKSEAEGFHISGISETEKANSETQNADISAKAVRSKFDLKGLVVMAFATSIDALIIGVTQAFLDVNIWESISVIGVVTFILSFFGVFLGTKIGAKLGGKAEILGGVILVAIGLKILLEHLGILVL